MMRSILGCALIGAAFAAPSNAYELRTHALISYEAVKKSRLWNDVSVTRDLGLQLSDPALSSLYYDLRGTERRERSPDRFETERFPIGSGVGSFEITGWILRGAIREDDLTTFGCFAESIAGNHEHTREPDAECNPQDDPYNKINRVVNHFFDPIFNTGLVTGVVTGKPATNWALGVIDAFASPTRPDNGRGNHFSIIDARRAMLYALRGKDETKALDKAERAAYWATAFRALGDAMHLLQDMAQPQHTRDDPHPGSVYEAYIERRARGQGSVRINGQEITPRPLVIGAYGVPAFTKYSDFWSGRDANFGAGLADYSNRGFFTDRRNIDDPTAKYGSPVRNPAAYRSRTIIDPDYPNGPPITFLDGPVFDQLIGNSREIHLTNESTINEFLRFRTKYYLNRHNFDDYAELLMPRAVAYSAGLLDYFFRGSIDCVKDVSLPGGCRVRNLTGETMRGAFEIYYEADDGYLYAVKNPQWASITDLAPSDPNDLSDGTPLVFDEPDTPAPKKRGNYTVVFHGDLGDERADDSAMSYGAVVAKQVKLGSGALYVLVANTATRTVVTVRTDGEGTRGLASNEADPLEFWAQLYRTQLAFGLPVFPLSGVPYYSRQVLFGTSPTQYRTLSLQMLSPPNILTGNTPTSYLAVDQGPKDYERVDGYWWSAKPQDKTLGAFRFTTVNGTTLSYSRAFRQNGVPVTQTGQVPLALPSHVSAFGSFIIDGSGTRIGEYAAIETVLGGGLDGCVLTETTSATTRYYDLVLSLGVTPSAAFQQVDELSSNSTASFTPEGMDECPGFSGTGSSVSRTREAFSSIRGDRQRLFTTSTSNSSGQGIGCSHTSSGTTTTNYDFFAGSLPGGSISQTVNSSNTAGPPPECAPIVQNQYSGQLPIGPYLIGDAAQQLIRGAGLGAPFLFRGLTVADNAIVRDVSPIGEMFFAKTDGSLIIHEPRNQRMPVFVMPVGFNRILTAVWM